MRAEIKIRRASEKDAEVLSDLLTDMQKEEAAFDELLRRDFASEDLRKTIFGYVIKRIKHPKSLVLVAEEDNCVIGLLIGKEIKYPTIYRSERIFYHENIFVVKEKAKSWCWEGSFIRTGKNAGQERVQHSRAGCLRR